MSDFVPRIFDGLTSLTRELLDNATQQNWLQIENPDKGREPPEVQPRTDRTAAKNLPHSGSAPSKPSPSPGAGGGKARIAGDTARGDNPSQTNGQTSPVQPQYVRPEQLVKALRENRNDPKGGDKAQRSHPATTGGGIGLAVPVTGTKEKAAPVLSKTVVSSAPISSGLPANMPNHAARTERTVATDAAMTVSAPVAGRGGSDGAAVARIERILVSAGAQMAAQELHAAVRSLSVAEVSLFLDRSSALVATIFEQACRAADAGTGTVEDKQRSTRSALALAHLSAAIDKDPRSPSTMRLQQDISSVVLASATPNDNTIFTGLAQAIGVGAGVKLALMVASVLADQEDDPSRARSLLALMAAGFARLGERIDEAHGAVIQCLGPLLVEWIAWRAGSDEDAIAALMDFISRRLSLLENLGPRLDRVEQVGKEAFRALRDLASCSFDKELGEVRRRFTASESVFGSIAASRTALREIDDMAAAGTTGENGGPVLDAVKLVLTHIGFDAPRAAFLANLSQIGHGSMLGANWTALESFTQMEAQGRLFQQLLAFLNGQYIVEKMPVIISFDDLDI